MLIKFLFVTGRREGNLTLIYPVQFLFVYLNNKIQHGKFKTTKYSQ
jgi:hypothetical protein